MSDERALHDEGMHQDWQGGPSFHDYVDYLKDSADAALEREQGYREIRAEKERREKLAQLGELALRELNGKRTYSDEEGCDVCGAIPGYRPFMDQPHKLAEHARVLGLLPEIKIPDRHSRSETREEAGERKADYERES